MQRQAALDGVRGLAIVVVLLHHHALLNSGWIGVDVFFVLSGYLITTILRRSARDSTYWKKFWSKRATRILPPLCILLPVLLFVYHLPFRWAGGLFLTAGDWLAYKHPLFEPSGVLWSLAVEEHFYFLWPFAVRLLNRKQLIITLILVIFVEPLLRGAVVAMLSPAWYFAYYLTAFRLDGLALGCLLALLFENKSPSVALKKHSGWAIGGTAAVYFGLRLVLGVSFTRSGNNVLYNALVYSLTGLLSFYFLAYVITHRHSHLSNLLSSKPLVFIGRISYGLYLYHTVVRDALMHSLHKSMHQIVVLSTCVSILIAYLSFRFVEQPVMSWGSRWLSTRGAEQIQSAAS